MFRKAFWIFGIFASMGVLMNAVVMAANDFKMPVLHGHLDGKHSVMTSEANLKALADIYELRFGDTSCMFSVGDVFIIVGVLPLGFFLFCYLIALVMAQEALKLIKQSPSPRRLSL